MKINIYGLGYVGSVTAACLANMGHDVQGIDVEPSKVENIRKGKSPIVEEGLDKLLKKVVKSGRLSATTASERLGDVSIVCVGTPSDQNGSLQLEHIHKVTEQIAAKLSGRRTYHVLVYRSTMLPGTVTDNVIPLLEKVSKKKAGQDFGVCMVPEFLREGSSLKDYFSPPFTVVGEYDARSGDRVIPLFSNISAPIIRTKIPVAEMVKYTCNIFHALKVTFANEIGSLCKSMEIDSHEVMAVVCRDRKLNLSPYYLKPGFAYGGSCLPKDLRAMKYRAKERDVEIPLIAAIDGSNRGQIDRAFSMIAARGSKRVGLLGLSFKIGTDDLRESPMVELAERMIGKGYHLKIYDREVNLAMLVGSNKKYIERVMPHLASILLESVEEVVENSDVVVVTKNSGEYAEALTRARRSTMVVDLVKIAVRTPAEYSGFSW